MLQLAQSRMRVLLAPSHSFRPVCMPVGNHDSTVHPHPAQPSQAQPSPGQPTSSLHSSTCTSTVLLLFPVVFSSPSHSSIAPVASSASPNLPSALASVSRPSGTRVLVCSHWLLKEAHSVTTTISLATSRIRYHLLRTQL